MKMLGLFASLLFAGSLAAQPQGFHLAAGDASPPVVDAQGNMVIQSGSKAIVNWDSFSIATAEQVHFQQQGSTSAILNRVTGSQGSDLLGLLSSNGRVLLINPNGVFIGQAGRIETADFLASTFDVFDADFLQEKDLLFCGSSDKSIQNLGTISCPTGNIHLFAAQVVNEGALQAASGKVLLATGGDILLQKDGSSHIYIRPELTQEELEGAAIDNQGSIEAMVASLQAGDSPYAKAIRCSGTIDATVVQEIGGEIYLVAEKGITEIDGGALTAPGGIVHILGEKVGLQNKSLIDVSAPSGGGTVLIGGDLQGQNPEIQNAILTFVSKESKIKADALEIGDGGKVIVWSDEMTFAYGDISTRGGESGGDGGFVEVSGKYLDFQGLADRRAPQGNFGMLLLDPINITIDGTPDSANITNPNLSVVGSSGEYLLTACAPTPANINASTAMSPNSLEQNLNIGFVTISTSAPIANTCVDVGTITVSSAVSWNAATTLTLIADSNIAINQPISNTFVTATPFQAMTFTANGTGSTATGIAVSANLTCPNAPGNITLSGIAGATGAADLHGVSIIAATVSTLGSIALSGTGGTGGTCDGVLIQAGSCIATNGTITFSNCIGGTGAAGGNHGVLIENVSVLSALNIIATDNIVGGANDVAMLSAGFFIRGAHVGTASTQSIAITGSATGTGTNNIGVLVNGTTSTTLVQVGGSGTIVLNGTGSGVSGGFGSSLEAGATITSASGNILVTGEGGSGNFGVTLDNTFTINSGTGNILFSSLDQINLGSGAVGCNVTTGGGNITFDGPVVLSASSNLVSAGGSGSVFFSSTVDGIAGAFSFAVSAGGSVTFSGAIGSNTPLTSLTVQPGSGFSTSPTFGTVPNGTVTFGGPSITTTGAISISATGRTQPMSIATIIGTGNLTITSGSFTMGANESLTVLGNLTIDGALSLSDVVAAGNLILTGSSITLNPQAPALYLSSTGSFYTSPNAHIIGLKAPTVTPAVTPASSRVLASGFLTEASFAKVLQFGGTVLNYDIHSSKLPLVQAVVNQLVVANSQVVANGPWGLLPILDLRFFPIYAICPVNTQEQPCTTGVFVPFIFESDIIDGNIFRSL